MNLTIIGGGNMGSAIARGLLAKNNQDIKITISDRSPEKLSSLESQGVTLTTNNIEAVAGADVIMIAIKPQYVDELFEELKGKVPTESAVVSICAGVEISRFIQGMNHSKIIRVMPNTPAKVSEGMSGWYASQDVTETQKQYIRDILSSIGYELEVNTEDLIDAVTAVSGSGPAYFFYFLEHIVAGGVELGLTPDQAKSLALQTAIGAVKLAQTDDDTLTTLREKVTSKGGTTEAALNCMKEHQVGENISKAVNSAYKRAKEL